MAQQQRPPEDLEARLDDLEKRLDAVSNGNMNVWEVVDDLQDRLDVLEEEVERARGDAAAAYELIVDQEDGTKVGRARALVRDELVRRTAVDVAMMERPVTNAEIREMAKPEHELDWQTVDDAFGKLVDEWPCFRWTEKRDYKALTIDRDTIPRELVRLAERSLEREDLAKEVLGG